MAVVQHILRRCEAVARKNGAKKISEITVEIGDFTMIVNDMFRRLFEIAKIRTLAEKAKLVLIKSPGIVLCKECNQTTEIWFGKIQDSLNTAQKEKLNQFKSGVEKNGPFNQNPQGGSRLFECSHCGSGDTSLVKGKNIIIRNIRV